MRPPPYKDARSIRRCRTFCAVIVTSGATPAAAQETCWTARHAQFFNAVHYCVSSALTPQGDNNYGRNISPDGRAIQPRPAKAFVAIRSARRLRSGSKARFHSTGYWSPRLPQSAQSHANNGRSKAVETATDTGFRTLANLPIGAIYCPSNCPIWRSTGFN